MSRLSEVFLPPEMHRAACRGEPAACRAIYDAVAGPSHALIRRLVGPAAAEDLFQDTMMRTFERLADYRSEAPFGMWVRTIAVNACLMHLRSPWRRLQAPFAARARVDAGAGDESWQESGAIDVPERIGDAVAARLDVERLLAGLAPVARTVLWLHEIEGYSHEDIAAAFGRSASFSKSQLARAHSRLRQQVAPVPDRAASGGTAPGRAAPGRPASGWRGLIKGIP